MLNIIWIALIVSSIFLSLINGTTDAVVLAVTTGAQQAVMVAIGLVGVMSLWLGIMRIAEDAGLVKLLSRWLNPVMKKLFPGVPSDHPAMGTMTLNIAANMLGLGNAATPFGLRAMEELAKLNPYPKIASNAMCTFLAINTSSIQLIPTTAMAILAANGDPHPTHIIFPTLVATSCSTLAAIFAVKWFEKLPLFSYRGKPAHELTAAE
jgi:spore maturation protein A